MKIKGDISFTADVAKAILLPIQGSTIWFPSRYIIFLLILPILNLILEHIDKFHQIDFWYMFLWTYFFKVEYIKENLHGILRIGYIVFAILLIFLVEFILDIIRKKIFEKFTNKKQYIQVCSEIDDYLNFNKDLTEDTHKEIGKYILLIYIVYMIIAKIIISIMYYTY